MNTTAIQKFVGSLLTIQYLEMSDKISPLSKFGKHYFYYHIRLPDFNERNAVKAYRRNNTLVQLNNQAEVVRKKVKKLGFLFSISEDLGIVEVQY